MITSEQVRAARGLLRIEQDDLARRAEVSVATVRRIEAVGGTGRVAPETVRRVRLALEAAGAEFVTGGVLRRQPDERDLATFAARLREIADRTAARPILDRAFSEQSLYGPDGLPR